MIRTLSVVQRINRARLCVEYLTVDPAARLPLETDWSEHTWQRHVFSNYDEAEKAAKTAGAGYPVVLSGMPDPRAPRFLPQTAEKGAHACTAAGKPGVDPRRTHYGYEE